MFKIFITSFLKSYKTGYKSFDQEENLNDTTKVKIFSIKNYMYAQSPSGPGGAVAELQFFKNFLVRESSTVQFSVSRNFYIPEFINFYKTSKILIDRVHRLRVVVQEIYNDRNRIIKIFKFLESLYKFFKKDKCL